MNRQEADEIAAEMRARGYEATRSPDDSYVPYSSKAPITYNVIVWRKATTGTRVRVEREILETIDVVVPDGEPLDQFVDELPLEDWTREIKQETRKHGD